MHRVNCSSHCHNVDGSWDYMHVYKSQPQGISGEQYNLKTIRQWRDDRVSLRFIYTLRSQCSMWALNWILYEPIWKRSRFRSNIKEPFVMKLGRSPFGHHALASDIWWRLLETCSNLFHLGTHQPTPHPPGMTSGGGHWNWKHVRLVSVTDACTLKLVLCTKVKMDCPSATKMTILMTLLANNKFWGRPVQRTGLG